MTSTIAVLHQTGSPVVSFCRASLRLAVLAALLSAPSALAQEATTPSTPPAEPTTPEATPSTTTATSTEEPAKAEPAQAEPAKEEPAKEEPAKEEPTKEEPTKEEPTKAPERPKNVVTVNVPSNIFGAYSIELSRVLTDHVAVFVEPTFFLIPPQEGLSKGIMGPGVVIGTMIHPFADAPDGLFVAPELYVTRLDSLGDDFGGDLGLGFGAVGGYSMRFFDHLMVSLGLGATANVLGYNLAGERGFGVMPILRANIGAAF